MTASTALLIVAVAAAPGTDDVLPTSLTGLTSPRPTPVVTSIVPRPPAAPRNATIVRGQSPGWSPAVPVGPGFGQSPYSPPTYGQPGYGQPAPGVPSYGSPGGASPYSPATPLGPEFAPPQMFDSYGVNGPQPYDYAPEFRFDAGYIFPANAEGRPGDLAVTELDFVYEADSPDPFGGVVTVAPEYRLRMLSGPGADLAAGEAPLPGNLHRLGVDLAVMSPKVNGWSATAGFTPSVNTDFEDDLTELGRQYDGRAAVFYDVNPTLTLVGGVKYYDRLDDLILPWAGAVWRPDDRWEIRAVFPEPRIEYFYGPALGKPMWLYAEGQFHRESWQFSPGAANLADVDEVQFTDLRFLVGARKEQGWGRTFLEAGIVFDRDVKFRRSGAGDFEVNESLLLRGGVRF